MIVPIGTTSWRGPVYSRSLTTIKGANLNIWTIWFERPRHSAGLSVFNQANTPISNFYNSSNFHLSSLDLNSDNKWYLAANKISSKQCTKLNWVFQFTTMELSSAFMRTKDSSETKDPSQRFRIKLRLLPIDSKPQAVKRSFQRSRKSKVPQEIKATKIQKMSCECRSTAIWVEILNIQNFQSNKRPSSTKWTNVLRI